MKCKVCGSECRYYEEVMGAFTAKLLPSGAPDFSNREFTGDAVSIGVECSSNTLHETGYYYDVSTKTVREDVPTNLAN